MNINKRLLSLATATVAALSLQVTTAYAAPLPAGLGVDTEVVFDDIFSINVSGDFDVTDGGATTTSTYDASSIVTGDNPLLGAPTDTGDGAGFSGASGDIVDDVFTAGFDLYMDLVNTHATDVYVVTFGLSWSNMVSATGSDAYSYSELSLFDTGTNTEIHFSDLESDTFFGNQVNGVITGGFGGALSDSGAGTFTFTLNPLDVLNLELSWTAEGDDLVGDGLISTDLFADLTITDVVVRTPAPTPLLLIGLGMLLISMRKYLKL